MSCIYSELNTVLTKQIDTFNIDKHWEDAEADS